MAAPDWTTSTLAAALDAVESTARRHGYASPRCPENSEAAVQETEARIGFAFPTDLRTFLLWHDPDLWSHFVNPDRALLSDANILTVTGEKITPDHSHDRSADCPFIDKLPSIDAGLLTPDLFGTDVEGFLENMAKLRRPESWRSTRLIAFGSSGYFEPLVYCLDATDSPAGAIITFVGGDSRDRMWLADSLAAWFARMVACDGSEYAFMPGSYEDLPPQVRSVYVREFRDHNPESTFFK